MKSTPMTVTVEIKTSKPPTLKDVGIALDAVEKAKLAYHKTTDQVTAACKRQAAAKDRYDEAIEAMHTVAGLYAERNTKRKA